MRFGCLAAASAVLLVGGDALARPAVPVGIRYATPLEKGERSLSYSYRRETNKGLRDGTHRIDAADATSGALSQVPAKLETDVHTFGVRYAPFERLTVALSLPLLEHEMTNRDLGGGGNRYTTKSSGIGDLELVGMIPFMRKGDESLDLYAGMSLPTGEISERDDVPGEDDELLPFPMQTGSRSVILVAGLTYRGHREGLGWGVHGNGSIGVEDNHRGYRKGDVVSFSGWLAHDVTDWLSGSLRLGFDHWRRHHGKRGVGQDDHVSSRRSATAGKRLELSPGVSVGIPWVDEQRLSFEASWPVYQNLNGPQVERDWTLTTGWEWVF